LIGALDFEASCSQRLLSELIAEHFARLTADKFNQQLAGHLFGVSDSPARLRIIRYRGLWE